MTLSLPLPWTIVRRCRQLGQAKFMVCSEMSSCLEPKSLPHLGQKAFWVLSAISITSYFSALILSVGNKGKNHCWKFMTYSHKSQYPPNPVYILFLAMNEVCKQFPRIRDLREDADLTQQQVADYLHCSQSLYAYYESGKRNLPVDNLILLAKLYHVSTDYILGLTNNPMPYEN